MKLGRWTEYLAMREGIQVLNTQHRSLLSNDLGAITGLLFDIGSGRYAVSRVDDYGIQWENDLARVQEETASASRARATALENDHTHTEIQGWLRDLGKAMGYDIWIASNDKNRLYLGERLSEGCLPQLPDAVRQSSAVDTVALIDVLWIAKDSRKIVAAFEVEHSTSIYSGIVRMLDLALGIPDHGDAAFFLVAPDAREQDVGAQFSRPAFSRVSEMNVRYLGYSQLKQHKEAIARFGNGLKGIVSISTSLASQ